MTTVRMLNSVGELAAGETVDLPDAQADEYIIKGYAEGELSREHTEEEQEAHLADVQEVTLGG